MTARRIVVAIALLVAIVFPQIGAKPAMAQPTVTAPPGDPIRGKATFARYGCAACHGTVGQGSDFNAPTLAPHPKPYAFIIGYIRKPVRLMPAQSPLFLPDSDVADIYAYLQSIPATKPVSAIPALAGITTAAR
jgi:mono/diheme cytochrome c family protein